MYRLPEAKKAEIITALREDPHAKRVAEQVGDVSISTVWRLAKEAGIELTAGNAAKGRNGPRMTEKKRIEIIRALEANPNATAVSRQIGGITPMGVWFIAKKAGIELTGGGGNRQSPERHAEIIRALEANPNATAVSRQIGGITPMGVWKIAKKAGIKLTAGTAARGHRHPEADQHLVGRAMNRNAPGVA